MRYRLRTLLPPALAVLVILTPIAASFVANRLFTGEAAGRAYCVKSLGYKDSAIHFLGSNETIFGSDAEAEFKIDGTEPVGKYILRLKRSAYFLPWRVESYMQWYYKIPQLPASNP
jgi:hypothetical protein